MFAYVLTYAKEAGAGCRASPGREGLPRLFLEKSAGLCAKFAWPHGFPGESFIPRRPLTREWKRGKVATISKSAKQGRVSFPSPGRERAVGASPWGREGEGALELRGGNAPPVSRRYWKTKCVSARYEFRWNRGQCFVRPEPMTGSGRFLLCKSIAKLAMCRF